MGAFPPLAALVADVALFRKPLWKSSGPVDVGDEDFADVLACFLGVSLVGGRVGRIVAGGLVLMRIQPGGQRHQRGPAQGGGHVASPEQHAFRRQLVEVGRFDGGMPHESVIGVALVIGNDQDDVGGVLRGDEMSRPQERQGKRCNFLNLHLTHNLNQSVQTSRFGEFARINPASIEAISTSKVFPSSAFAFSIIFPATNTSRRAAHSRAEPMWMLDPTDCERKSTLAQISRNCQPKRRTESSPGMRRVYRGRVEALVSAGQRL